MVKSTRKPRARKLPKNFPLWLHPSGRWCKKIRGRAHYFGKTDDPQGALDRYLAVKDDLHAGRTPRTATDGLTIKGLGDRFMTAKKLLLDSGDIVPRTFQTHYETCKRVVDHFGRNRLVSDLRPDDFAAFRAELAKSLSALTLRVTITRIRTIFNFARDEGLLDEAIRFGQGFRLPSKRTILVARHKNGPRMVEAEDILKLLQASDTTMKAIILIGINGGFGPHDIGRLPSSAVDLQAGWVDFPRPKSGVFRRVPIWRETVAAVKEAAAVRPEPKNLADCELLFITSKGNPWASESSNSAVTGQFRKLLKEVGIYRAGVGFYALRHTFETVAGESIDQVAVDFVMGHTRNDMASVYRERISDGRLRAVVNHVHKWLFGDQESE